MYGGISILMNEGIAIRSLKVTEDSYFYILPREIFLDTCSQYEAFSDFFTDIFGKRMLDRFYAEIIAGNRRPSEQTTELFNLPVESIYSKDLVCRLKAYTARTWFSAIRTCRSRRRQR
jgi:CBS domain-containing protein